jgi:glycosyltransferase involved in cell wall biosynthesis
MAEVTVVIPTHNRRALLTRTLHSVLAQRDVDTAVVVVDDGGSDGTAKAVDDLNDSRVVVERHDRPRGVSAARNSGIATAVTPWLAFVDDDDLWAPSKLRSQLDALSAHSSAQWSCTGSVNIDRECRLSWWAEPPGEADVGSLLLRQNVIPGGGSGVVASRELTLGVGGFDEALSNLADWDFYIRLGLRSPLAAVSRPLLGYYIHPQGMAHDVRRSELEYRYVEVKYGSQRRQREVTLNHEAWLHYLSRMAYRGGHRRAAIRMSAELVGRYRRWRTLGSVVTGLTPGQLRPTRGRRADVPLPPGWADEAQAWLAPYACGWFD